MLLKRNEVRQMILRSVREREIEREREESFRDCSVQHNWTTYQLAQYPSKKGRFDYSRVMNE